MTTAFTRTREQMRDMILRKLRVLGVDQTASAEADQIVIDAMDVRLKELHRLGIAWWKVDGALTDLSLSAGTAFVSTPSDILFPITLSIRDGSQDTALEIVDHRTFQAIPNKLDTGFPEKALFHSSIVRFHPIPVSAYVGKLTYEKIIDDTAASTAPDIRVEAMRWFRDLVAYDCADDFQLPEPRVMRLKAEADIAEKRLRALFPQRGDFTTVEATYF